MLTIIFTVTALLPIVLTSPLQPQARQSTASNPFTLIAIHSGNPSLQYQSINAANDSFYIGIPTSTYCPTFEGIECPPGNVTALIVDNESGGAALDVEVPGGQLLYVLPTGALSYTPAHSEGSSSNGTTTGFSFTNGTAAGGTLGEFSFSGLGSAGFLACPIAANATAYGPYQIFAAVLGITDADVPSGNLSSCQGIDTLGAAFDGGLAAWEYE